MEIFAILCLIIVMFTLQHLINWMCRAFYKDDKLITPLTFAIMITFGVTYVCIYHIILWGKYLV